MNFYAELGVNYAEMFLHILLHHQILVSATGLQVKKSGFTISLINTSRNFSDSFLKLTSKSWFLKFR